MENSGGQYKARIDKKMKEDIYKAQRMYILAQKLGSRIPQSMSKFSKENLDKYTKYAKEIELRLTIEELYDRLFDI